jgi:hypothetical protein
MAIKPSSFRTVRRHPVQSIVMLQLCMTVQQYHCAPARRIRCHLKEIAERCTALLCAATAHGLTTARAFSALAGLAHLPGTFPSRSAPPLLDLATGRRWYLLEIGQAPTFESGRSPPFGVSERAGRLLSRGGIVLEVYLRAIGQSWFLSSHIHEKVLTLSPIEMYHCTDS